MTPDYIRKHDLLLFASLVLLELSIAAISMAMYMKGDRPFSVFLWSNPGIVFFLAVGILPISCAFILQQYFASSRSSLRHFYRIVIFNVVSMTLILAMGEIMVRELADDSREGETFLNRMLLPKSWGKVTRHQHELVETIGRGSGHLSYMVSDDLLGWTVAPNSGEGLNWISSEGVRGVPDANTSMKLVKHPGTTSIALVGDSVTFGAEVAYEDSWGYFLEKALGGKIAVMNFGVPGYAVDQAYLRYQRDVQKWKPKVVIYGFMAHAAVRTMMVYPFISLPNLDIPFSKPRFIVRNGELKTVNVPVLPPTTIFSRESISELPFLQYDAGYKQSEWQRRLFHVSYLARLCVSRFADWTAVNPQVTEEALVSVNSSILKAFIESVTQSGAIPLVVYFPQTQELDRANPYWPLAKRVLEEANIAYIDMTPCLRRLKPTDRVLPSSGHYSSQGNAAIANCLLPSVNQALAASKATA